MKKFQEPHLFRPWVPDILCRVDVEPTGTAPGGDDPIATAAAGAAPTRAQNGSLAVLSREEWVAVAGLLEATAAVGILIPATRRIAAVGAAGMAAAVLAAVAWNQPRSTVGTGRTTVGDWIRR